MKIPGVGAWEIDIFPYFHGTSALTPECCGMRFVVGCIPDEGPLLPEKAGVKPAQIRVGRHNGESVGHPFNFMGREVSVRGICQRRLFV